MVLKRMVCLLAMVLLSSTPGARAAITVLHEWNLGENDASPTIPGIGSDPTIDIVGGLHLPRIGAPQYETSSVPGGGSTHALHFNNPYAATANPASVDYFHSDERINLDIEYYRNWGVEAWVRFDSLPPAGAQNEIGVVHIGNLQLGWLIQGVRVAGTEQFVWAGHVPGVILVESDAEIQTGQWTHVALVNNNLTMQLYVDGEHQFDFGVGPINPRAGVTLGSFDFTIDSGPVAGLTAARGMHGAIDAVRVFQFEDDAFNINDTFVNGVPGGGPIDVAGDFNGDGNVDGADFVVWQTNFPNNSGLANLGMGDANGDGNVDGADFVVWQTNFPFTTGMATPVPEPASWALACLTFLGALGMRRGC